MTADDPAPGFATVELSLLREAREVRIETRAGDDRAIHRTIIWVIVDRHDRAMVRTYRGPRSRWYREAVGYRKARLLVADRTIDVDVQVADDADGVAAYSDALLRKYAGDPATTAMLRAEVLSTTLQLTRA